MFCIYAEINIALNAIAHNKRKGVAMMYIKTMTNSWFTSRRLANAGVPQLNCIFGCEDCVDDLHTTCDVASYGLWSALL